MARNPSLEIDRTEPLADALARDRDDCMPCRVTGASAFIGLGAYSWWSGHTQLERQQAKILASKSIFGMKSRQTGITGISLSLIGLGLWRLFN